MASNKRDEKRKKTRTRRPARILAYINLEAKNKPLLDLVARLSNRDGAPVLALSVLRELPWYARVGSGFSKRVREALEKEAESDLERELAPLVKAGVTVQAKVEWGRPYETIIREVLRKRTQLVLTAAHGDGRGEFPRFGSTAMHLFRQCPAPVLVVQPRRIARIRSVLAAVDPVQPASEEFDLNPAILEWAAKISDDEGAALHVCHAYQLLGKPTLRKSAVADSYEAYRRNALEHIDTAMTQLFSRAGLAPDDGNVHVLRGHAGDVIPALVRKQKTSLLVMGTIARAGVPGLLIGNTAERMLSKVDCSVLAIKPKGFVSPVGMAE